MRLRLLSRPSRCSWSECTPSCSALGSISPPPQLDQNPDVSIDLVWFSRRAQAAVGLTVLPEGDADGKLWLHVLVANQSSDSFDPEDSVIEQYLTKFVTVARS